MAVTLDPAGGFWNAKKIRTGGGAFFRYVSAMTRARVCGGGFTSVRRWAI
jgi:hypothetical protein